MKLYNTKTGIIIEKDEKFYLAQNENWNSFINDDDIINKVEDLLKVLRERDDVALEDLLAPIGDRQELWACGVTYLRSKVERQAERWIGKK